MITHHSRAYAGNFTWHGPALEPARPHMQTASTHTAIRSNLAPFGLWCLSVSRPLEMLHRDAHQLSSMRAWCWQPPPPPPPSYIFHPLARLVIIVHRLFRVGSIARRARGWRTHTRQVTHRELCAHRCRVTVILIVSGLMNTHRVESRYQYRTPCIHAAGFFFSISVQHEYMLCVMMMSVYVSVSCLCVGMEIMSLPHI